MSEEQHNEETEVEAHGIGGKVDHPQKFWANDETDVEAHGIGGKVDHPQKFWTNDEPDSDDEVEAHMKYDRPRHS